MYQYKLIVAYEGTNYYGWQAQKKIPSISYAMQETFQQVFRMPLVLRGASRTDAGVHAVGQVCSVKTALSIDPDSMRNAWNTVLPSTIHIRSVETVSPFYNIFHNIQYKIYYYHFFEKPALPFIHRYGLYVKRSIQFDILQDALVIFQGTHDFRAFCSSEDTRSNMIRTIYSIKHSYLKRFKVHRITVIGTSFLRHMIRRIVGAALEVATRKNLDVSILQEALKSGKNVEILPNAPAHGLILYKIVYNNGEL